ncbi:MAG: hypothetical protein N2167_03205 [Flavobacteriales bacterium]|nr:hypothetical protein [Flavobacteriales bacterium]
MNEVHIHLLTNHLPIILPACGLSILLAGMILKSEVVIRVGFAVLIGSGLATIPAQISGEGAEEIAENIVGINEASIEEHEDQAKYFSILSYILGAAGILGMILSLKKSSVSKFYTPAIIIYGILVMYFAYKTGNSGGKIRHTEIISGGSAMETTNQNTENTTQENNTPQIPISKEEDKEYKEKD